MSKKILFIDNYDSFSYTIVMYFKELGFECKVVKNDDFTSVCELDAFDFTHLVLSPGPNAPQDAPLCINALKRYRKSKKILGICLGHQCITHAFGGQVVQQSAPTHAKVVKISCKNEGIFHGLPKRFKVCLYNSLCVGKTGEKLRVLATDEAGRVMALRHKKHQIYGVQFHPEAILSQNGKRILANFMAL